MFLIRLLKLELTDEGLHVAVLVPIGQRTNPPRPVVETTGETIPESRPGLAKARPVGSLARVIPLRRVG